MTPFTDLEAAIDEADFLSVTDDEPYAVVDSDLIGVMYVMPLHEAPRNAVICTSSLAT